jgi:hypothetical protein
MNNNIKYIPSDVIREALYPPAFYPMPRFLFEGEFRKLSNNAKVLYSILCEQHELSIKNRLANDDGEVYLIFSRENMCNILNLSRPTVSKVMNELKKFNLIDEERVGLGEANRIYLLKVDSAEADSTT